MVISFKQKSRASEQDYGYTFVVHWHKHIWQKTKTKWDFPLNSKQLTSKRLVPRKHLHRLFLVQMIAPPSRNVVNKTNLFFGISGYRHLQCRQNICVRVSEPISACHLCACFLVRTMFFNSPSRIRRLSGRPFTLELSLRATSRFRLIFIAE